MPRPRQRQGRPVPPHGLRPPGVQILRPACEDHERHLPQGARPSWQERRPASRGRGGAGEDCSLGRVLCQEELVSQRGLLLGDCAAGHGDPRDHVHCAVVRPPPRTLNPKALTLSLPPWGAARWHGLWAGWRSGRRWPRRRSPRSRGRGSSTPGRCTGGCPQHQQRRAGAASARPRGDRPWRGWRRGWRGLRWGVRGRPCSIRDGGGLRAQVSVRRNWENRPQSSGTAPFRRIEPGSSSPP
mmetsp:Transcript_45568/g.145039  ORF Transcript_45568/g.145039 Transcript_45568/m.145039 type:complete len:241 (-) Transcript_45568:532-1254(-)